MKIYRPIFALFVFGYSGSVVGGLGEDLSAAANNDQYAKVQEMLDANPTSEVLEWRDRNGDTPLLLASRIGSVSIVKALLDPKRSLRADPNAKNNRGKTALMVTSSTEVAQSLLDAGANVNAIDNDGITALGHASNGWFIDIVKLLVAAGANVEAINGVTGETEVMTAVMDNKPEIAVALMKSAKVNVNAVDTVFHMPMLFWAMSQLSRVMVVELLKAGANANVADSGGQTLLMRAIKIGQPKIIDVLVTQGKADVNARDKEDRSALDWADMLGYSEMVKYLKEHGAKEAKKEVVRESREAGGVKVAMADGAKMPKRTNRGRRGRNAL